MQTQTGEITDPDEDWICEETAWGVIEARGWIASPELLMYLTQYVREVAQEGEWFDDVRLRHRD